MKHCPGCPGVPVVSKALATRVLSRVPRELRPQALQRAMEWLTRQHEGITLYLGIHGRPYTNIEKDAIAVETSAVSSLPCPFVLEGGCIIGGLGPHYNRVEEMKKPPYGWLPTFVALTWDTEGYRGLVKAQSIADAKVCELTRNEGFLSKDEQGRIYVG